MKKISYVRIKAREIRLIPRGMLEAQVEKRIKAVKTIKKNIAEGKHDVESTVEKMVKPSLENVKSLIRPGFVNKSGVSIEDKLNVSDEKMRKYAERWKKTYDAIDPDSKEFRARAEHEAKYSIQDALRTRIPFSGYGDEVPGVGPLAGRWLSGDKTVVNLNEYLNIIEGPATDIVREELQGRFKQKLANRIAWGGKLIVDLNYDQRTMNQVNVALDELVKSFVKAEYDCEINFVYDQGRLYLDVQVYEKEITPEVPETNES